MVLNPANHTNFKFSLLRWTFLEVYDAFWRGFFKVIKVFLFKDSWTLLLWDNWSLFVDKWELIQDLWGLVGDMGYLWINWRVYFVNLLRNLRFYRRLKDLYRLKLLISLELRVERNWQYWGLKLRLWRRVKRGWRRVNKAKQIFGWRRVNSFPWNICR
jgi:hypothetical protein